MRKIKIDLLAACLLWTIVLQLPRTAAVLQEDDSGKTWRRSGEMGCAFPLAVTQWDSRLRYQGWKCQDSIPLDEFRSLTVWQKGEHFITVFLWQIRIGHTGFAWGECGCDQPE